MAETTGIAWTDSTFNPWIGCTKVGPGCDHCYAEAQDKRFGGAHWGVDAERKRTTPKYWRNLSKWNGKGHDFKVEHGHWRRVFIASQADVFDNAVPDRWREDLWNEIFDCPSLEIIIVTKRVGNIEKMAPLLGAFPGNVILLATVVNQAEADRDIPKLLALKEAGIVSRVGLSIEPLLGQIELSEFIGKLDWVIAGGESGPKARPMHPDWALSLRDQCAVSKVPFFFKQWGEWAVMVDRDKQDSDWRYDYSRVARAAGWTWINLAGGSGFHGERLVVFRKVGKAAAGDLLDGRQHQEFPA